MTYFVVIDVIVAIVGLVFLYQDEKFWRAWEKNLGKESGKVRTFF